MGDGVVVAAGTMSGTSLDGVDAALLSTDGRGIAGFGPVRYRAYAARERAVLRAALGLRAGAGGADAAAVADATAVVEAAHCEVLGALGGAAELVGFHGQTLFHDPGAGVTHQAGCGRRLAYALRLPVAWDFRSADVAAGGQGAPLAPFFHHAAARWAGLSAPVAVVNLGGVGNLTWLDPRIAEPDAARACLAFDTGPANAPLNDLMQARRGLPCDAGGQMAAAGRVREAVVAACLADAYFAAPPPKSLDRDAFAGLGRAVAHLSDADAAATLTACAAAAVAAGMRHCPSAPSRLLVTGGGRRNPVLKAMLGARCGMAVEPVEAIGLDGDMLEAQAFAYLAVRVLRGLAISAPGTTGVARPMTGGRISRPE